MNRNIRIAKQLVRLARALAASEPRYLSDNDISQRLSSFWLSEFQCDGRYETPNGDRYDVCAVVEFPNADGDEGGDFDSSRSVWFKVDADKLDACGENVSEISKVLDNAGDMNGIWLPAGGMKDLCDLLAECWTKIDADGTGKKYRSFSDQNEFVVFAGTGRPRG